MLPNEKSKPTPTLKNKLFFIHGQPKAGKSTFASTFPDALFAATEPGHNFLEVYKTDIAEWPEFRQLAAELIKGRKKEGDDFRFKTLIIDTADNLYMSCERFIRKREGIKHESELGFGKGYHLVRDEFKGVIDRIALTGFGIVFLSHSQDRDIETKTQKITRTDSTLGSTAKKYVSGLCDFIFYVTQDDEENRWLVTKGSECLNAGDRTGVLPKAIPLTTFDDLEKIYVERFFKKGEVKDGFK